MRTEHYPALPLLLLAAWTLLNLLQAGLTELDPDEAYYWMYASQLDWGYFDHPPAIALMIRLGYTLSHSELGVRLLVVLLESAGMVLLWDLVGRPRDRERLLLFTLIAGAMPMFQVYGFIATPDSPLLFFTILFFWSYERFLKSARVTDALLWGATMAALLYSKYHGVLLIGFTVLSNFRLLLRPRFYLAACFGFLLFFPHLYWQYVQDFPSFRYHLQGRDDSYQLKYTLNYLVNQLLIFNPLLLPVWAVALWRTIRQHRAPRLRRGYGGQAGTPPSPRLGRAGEHRQPSTDNRARSTEHGVPTTENGAPSTDNRPVWRHNPLHRTFYFVLFGFWFFFLVMTSKGHAEPQWTALLTIPLVLITYQFVADRPVWWKWIKWLGSVSLFLFFLVRIFLIFPLLPVKSEFHRSAWTQELQAVSKGYPVVFQNSYRDASKYAFYTGERAYTFTDNDYRRNQFDLWEREQELQNRRVLIAGHKGKGWPCTDCTFREFSGRKGYKLKWTDSLQVVQKIDLEVPETEQKTRAGDTLSIPVRIHNPYPHRVNRQAGNMPITLYGLFYGKGEQEEAIVPVRLVPSAVLLPPADTFSVNARLIVPDSLEGHYRLILGWRTGDLPPALNSNPMSLAIQ